MAVILESGSGIQRFRGLSADINRRESFPDAKSANAVFTASDTGERWVWGGSWPWVRQQQTIEIKFAELVDINQAILRVLEAIHRGHEEHLWEHDVEVEKKFGEIPPLACYPSQLNQVFLNLLVNAKHAMDGKGKITIETGLERGFARIAISDTGSGISDENLERVFDPGFTTKGVKVGTGLGLAISYRVIQDHQGEISVASKLGAGTTFTIRLPTDLQARLKAG